MILQNNYWYDVVPTVHEAGKIDGKWLFFGETKKIHYMLGALDELVESGQIRGAKVARKLPGIDPFPEKPCVLCVYTSEDSKEKEAVKQLLQRELGIEVKSWKSDEQTRRDWEEGGWLQLQYESNQLRRDIEAGRVTDEYTARTKLFELAKRIRALAETVKDPQRKLEIELNAIREAQGEAPAGSPDREEPDTVLSRLARLEEAMNAFSKKLDEGNVRTDSAHTETDTNTVFIIMPFDKSYIDTYDAISRAVKRAHKKLRVQRVDEIPGANAISDEIHRSIRTALLIICDLTAERPNVYYELGFAKGMNKRLICIAREGTTIHFDAYGMKTLFFGSLRELEDMLSKETRKLLAANLSQA